MQWRGVKEWSGRGIIRVGVVFNGQHLPVTQEEHVECVGLDIGMLGFSYMWSWIT